MLLNSAGATLLCRCEGQFEPAAADQAGRRWQRGLYHAAAAPDLADRLPSLSAMIGQASGWGTGILHVQGMRSDSGFHLTDINLRLPSTWDWLMAALDPSYHRRLLASLLFGEPFDPAWPAPAMAIDLVHGPKGSRLLWIDHAPPGEASCPGACAPPIAAARGWFRRCRPGGQLHRGWRRCANLQRACGHLPRRNPPGGGAMTPSLSLTDLAAALLLLASLLIHWE